MFYQSWHIAGFPWDKCQTPKKDFSCLRLLLGSIIEFVYTDLFHGSLKMETTKYRHGRVGMGFPPALFIFGIWFQVVWLMESQPLGSCSTSSLYCSYGTYIFLVPVHLLMYVLFLLLDHIPLEVMVLSIIGIEMSSPCGSCILPTLALQNLARRLQHSSALWMLVEWQPLAPNACKRPAISVHFGG